MSWLRRLGPSFLDPLFLAPIAIVAVIASLFSAVKYVEVRSERNAAREVVRILTEWGEKTCSAAGEVFKPEGERDASKWGRKCSARVLQLANFERQTHEASAKAAQEAIDEQQRKMLADQARARRADASRRTAIRNMEAANARITNDEVGGDWFRELNRLGGLRPWSPQTVPADEGDGAHRAGEGDPAHGPDDLPASP